MKYTLAILLILFLIWLFNREPVKQEPVTVSEPVVEVESQIAPQLGGQATETSPEEEFIMSN